MLDINLICRNNGPDFVKTLECLSNQTFEDFRVLILDDGSDDETPDICHDYMKLDKRFSYTRNDHRLYVGNFQRAFWEGDREFVLPKSSDDIIDPTYAEKCIQRLQEDSSLVLCHTASEIIDEDGNSKEKYPDKFNLRILDDDKYTRALKCAATYTVSPVHWGVYRRSAVAKLAPLPYCNGFDHIFLCELALYGKFDYVPELLYHRSMGGAPVFNNAKKATLQQVRDASINFLTSDFKYLTPYITMTLGHMEMARIARIEDGTRIKFIDLLVKVLVERFRAPINDEIKLFTRHIPSFKGFITEEKADIMTRRFFAREILFHIHGMEIAISQDERNILSLNSQITEFKNEINNFI